MRAPSSFPFLPFSINGFMKATFEEEGEEPEINPCVLVYFGDLRSESLLSKGFSPSVLIRAASASVFPSSPISRRRRNETRARQKQFSLVVISVSHVIHHV